MQRRVDYRQWANFRQVSSLKLPTALVLRCDYIPCDVDDEARVRVHVRIGQ